MCKALSQGGQRCAAHTRPAFTRAAFGTPAWDRAAAEHASTPAGAAEITGLAEEALAAGDLDRWAGLTGALRRGHGQREVAAVTAGLLQQHADERDVQAVAVAGAVQAAREYREWAERLEFYDEADPTGAHRWARKAEALARFCAHQAAITDPDQRPASPLWDDDTADSNHLWDDDGALAASEEAQFEALTRAERAVLVKYMAGDYAGLNLALRTGTPLSPDQEQALARLDAVFTATARPITEDTVLCRYYQPVAATTGNGLAYDPGTAFTPGQVAVDPGYLATTTSRVDQSRMFGSWQMLITVPAGTPVMAGDPVEREAVLGRDTGLRVVRVDPVHRRIETVVERFDPVV